MINASGVNRLWGATSHSAAFYLVCQSRCQVLCVRNFYYSWTSGNPAIVGRCLQQQTLLSITTVVMEVQNERRVRSVD